MRKKSADFDRNPVQTPSHHRGASRLRGGFCPSEADKSAGLMHVHYEIKQLLNASRIRSSDTSDSTVQDALLESALIHARVLLDFFEYSQRSTYRGEGKLTEFDDILALDYGFKASPISLCDSDRERLNKDLAHLTYSRCQRTEQSRRWYYPSVFGPIVTRAAEFIQHLLSSPFLLADRVVRDKWRNLLAEANRWLEEASATNEGGAGSGSTR